MSNKRVLSFSVCANGDIDLKVLKGHRLIIDQSNPTSARISTIPSIDVSGTDKRTKIFENVAKVGDVMDDGSIYAGISPSADQPFFVVAAEHLKQMRTLKMLEYIKTGHFHGQNDWQLASPEETAHLYTKRRIGQIDTLFDRRRKYYWAMKKNGDIDNVDRNGEHFYAETCPRFFFPIRYGHPELKQS